mmetsp:Transcript_27861/g.92629  ORF Transcript_27861/g.92629 Transcript_27861/m.92629 type:complete len:453 (-) Transcript_27861:34-1392(-)
MPVTTTSTSPTTSTTTATTTTTTTTMPTTTMPWTPPPTTKVTTTMTSTTTSPGMTMMTCDLNCYGTGSPEMLLPGADGSGAVPGTTMEQCNQLCEDNEECVAVVHGVTGSGPCWGHKDVLTSAAEGGCQTSAGGYVTQMLVSRRGPWGKCTALGDPHITSFDRKMYGAPDSADYMVPVNMYDAGEFKFVTSSALNINGRFGYTQAYTSAASTIGVSMSGPLIGGKALAVAYVGPTMQTPAYKGWKVMYDGQEILQTLGSPYLSPDGLVNATFADLDPTDFCVRCRSTIGGVAGQLYAAYVFELGGPDGGMQIYVLPGPDLSNVAITMRKLDGQDGLCGNFNCNKKNDTKAEMCARGWMEPVDRSASLFPAELESPEGWLAFRCALIWSSRYAAATFTSVLGMLAVLAFLRPGKRGGAAAGASSAPRRLHSYALLPIGDDEVLVADEEEPLLL